MSSSNHISLGAQHLYKLGYLYGFFSSAVIYIVLSKIWVPRRAMAKISTDVETVVQDVKYDASA
jgi:cytosine/uracil/thiamine/allantoin permease